MAQPASLLEETVPALPPQLATGRGELQIQTSAQDDEAAEFELRPEDEVLTLSALHQYTESQQHQQDPNENQVTPEPSSQPLMPQPSSLALQIQSQEQGVPASNQEMFAEEDNGAHRDEQQPLDPSMAPATTPIGSPSRNKKSSNAEELDVLSLLSLYWFLGLVLGRVFPQGRVK
ncbi:unknown protein [Seminavis robusta]|uniref:Uncharacterized protein n=1 Tax=Seminavis robusta TaxID=568900 RepID=A0A9N8EQK7_9STRA|nr:unknown protein [Seminavis robusta]|eukprot:Sro1445_g273400.1 n/a (175) ;mRNA; r:19068-19698